VKPRLKVISLAASHNRRFHTLKALTSLSKQEGLQGIQLQHVLVDDASLDDTATAVQQAFPGVQIVSGSGSLYWAGGMRLGWEKVVLHKELDFLFVYNDDTEFNPRALKDLLDTAQAWCKEDQPIAVIGTVIDPKSRHPSYGCRLRSSRWHPLKFANLITPNGTVQLADVANMNAALISRSALNRIGFLSPYFVHSGADYEWCLRLRKAGGAIVSAPNVVGTCSLNPRSDPQRRLPKGLRGRIEYLLDPKGEPLRQRWGMYRRHGGPLWLLLFLAPYFTIWLPRR
jgi:GT2 family glycosyltransferase